MPDTTPNPQDATINSLRATIQDMSAVSANALRAIETLAALVLHECDRAPGDIQGHLIVNALGDIAHRAADARDSLSLDAEQWGFLELDTKALTRGGNLNRSCAPGVSSNVLGGE